MTVARFTLRGLRAAPPLDLPGDAWLPIPRKSA